MASAPRRDYNHELCFIRKKNDMLDAYSTRNRALFEPLRDL